MHRPFEPLSMTPQDFELFVQGVVDAAADGLVDYRSEHQAALVAADGGYVIDVVATFSALGARFVVLVECKHLRRPVERQDVQVLHQKVQSLGAQKGMLFSVSGFQSGAIDYAKAHGIALVEVATGASNWHTRSGSDDSPSQPPHWLDVPEYIGWLCDGNTRYLVSQEHSEYLREFLGPYVKRPMSTATSITA